jgi:probable F420-dependent oxidoreductase
MRLHAIFPQTEIGSDPAVIARFIRDVEAMGFDGLVAYDHVLGADPARPGWSGPYTIESQFHEVMVLFSFAAAITTRLELSTGVLILPQRQTALVAKQAAALDVLSGGRAWLGIGAAWNEDESRSLGFPFPPLGQRFEMLEETLQIAHQMWQGERGSEAEFHGRHYDATRLMNSPQSISRPRVPIMIGGGGERKTLRLVAKYADASNVFGGPEMIAHKYAVIREHCADIGRNPDEIERTNLQTIDLGRDSPARIVDRFGELADAGAQHVIVSVADVHDPRQLETIGRDIVPQLRDL